MARKKPDVQADSGITTDQVMENLKYVPVLRYRQEEWAALTTVNLSSKILPLLEIIKELPRKGMKGSFETIYPAKLASLNRPLMVDFPTYLPIVTSTESEVASFLRPVQADPNIRVGRFRKLASVPNLIPVVTYNPQIPFISGVIRDTARSLRETFPRLAFRLFYNGFAAAISEVQQVAEAGDLFILDIDSSPHTSTPLKNLYQQIVSLGRRIQCKTVIIRSSIPDSLYNVNLPHDQPVPEIDNSLLQTYSTYRFDAFGDYAGIKKDLLRKGGRISPGFIFYSASTNESIGYRGRTFRLSEFTQYIVPSVLRSKYYAAYSTSHRSSCPGCLLIQNIANGKAKGDHQPLWKRIAIMHYLYTMDEYL